jgi:hypothetical protein
MRFYIIVFCISSIAFLTGATCFQALVDTGTLPGESDKELSPTGQIVKGAAAAVLNPIVGGTVAEYASGGIMALLVGIGAIKLRRKNQAINSLVGTLDDIKKEPDKYMSKESVIKAIDKRIASATIKAIIDGAYRAQKSKRKE